MINQMNDALKHINNTKTGLMDDLRKKVDHNIIMNFELTGLIQKGQEHSRKNSWKITEDGENLYYAANIKELYKPSPIEKVQSFLNKILSK